MRFSPHLWPSNVLLPHQVFEFIEERLLVLKIPVYRRKTDVRNLVQLLEMFHQKFPYFDGRYLPIG